jgi:transposase
MARTAQISKEKRQSIITLRQSQSMRNNSRTLKVSSSAVAKTIKRYDETGSHEDHHRKGRSRVTSAAEDKFIRVNCTLDCSPKKCFTEFK